MNTCYICGGSFISKFWRHHQRSNLHRNVLYFQNQDSKHPINGRVIRVIRNEQCVDIMFSNYENYLVELKKYVNSNQLVPSTSRPVPGLIPISAISSTSDPSIIQSVEESPEMVKEENSHIENIQYIRDFIKFYQQGINFRLNEYKIKLNALKVNLKLNIILIKRFNSGKDCMHTSVGLYSSVKEIFLFTNLSKWFSDTLSEIQTSYDELDHVVHSNWSLFKICDLELTINKYSPLTASGFIPLPISIETKHACINPQNNDEFCFKYAIAAKSLQNIKNAYRISNYTEEILSQYNFSNLTFPTPLNEINIFERNNDASVNIYGLKYEKTSYIVYPLRISKKFKEEEDKNWDLIYIWEDKGKEVNSHYVYIKNLSRLVSQDLSKHKSKLFYCRSCLQHFFIQEEWRKHRLYCYNHKSVIPEMPIANKNNIISFDHKKLKFQQEVPYIIYADFETALHPYFTCTPNPERSYTLTRHLHEPTSYCYYIVSRNHADDFQYTPYLYRGPEAVKHFWKSITKEILKIDSIYTSRKATPLLLSDEDEKNIELLLKAKPLFCYLCNEEIRNNEYVKDHCHLTGKFRGIAHNFCNLFYTLPSYVPIVFHNGSGYDFKLIIREIVDEDIKDDQNEILIDDDDDDDDTAIDESSIEEHTCFNVDESKNKKRSNYTPIRIIARSAENLISFEKQITKKISARFIDSFSFMASSLNTLASNLPKENLNHVRKIYQEPNKFILASQKGVFPYEYITDQSKYEELNLPKREHFYNSLTKEVIGEDAYQFAEKFYHEFECISLGDYSDHYLKIDVLLLSDIFENFRNICKKNYNLDPAWQYSAPGLSYNAMLKYTKKKIELITDYDMYLFVEAGIRGGFSQASKRYAKANNPQTNDYNQSKPNNYIFYVDANNLYGYSMSAHLPSHNFQWLSQNHLNIFNEKSIGLIRADGNVGYIFEVDLEYPKDFHEEHNDFPLCPEKLITIASAQIPKLVATLHNKNHYVLHHLYLQCALSHGLKLRKIHRGIQFIQSNWLKSYIDLNTNLRQKAVNEFEKNFYKLMNNAIFGKTLESCRKKRDFQLHYKPHLIQRRINKPNFKRRVILNEKSNLCLIEMEKLKLKFDKPIHCGVSILDISKKVMTDFHYDVMKPMFRENDEKIELLYTDTDSLIYNIRTSNLYSKLEKYKEVYFDFSNYPINHPCYSIKNKKVPGKFSDEVGGKIITEFVALRSKLYAFKLNEIDYKKAKGIKKEVVKGDLAFEDYMKTLTEGINRYLIQNSIQSKNMIVYTIEQCKLALSRDDDKRFIMDNKIDTLAWGHHEIGLINNIKPSKNKEGLKYLEIMEISEELEEEVFD